MNKIIFYKYFDFFIVIVNVIIIFKCDKIYKGDVFFQRFIDM